MPAAARRDRIVALATENGFVGVAEVSRLLGVSEVTVRSDLIALDRTGKVRRVHGGALLVPGEGRESPMEASVARDADLKRAIGRRAAALVRSGSSVLLDVGSTTLAVATALVERIDLAEVVVITNGLSIALALEPAIPRVSVVVTGGTLRPLQHSLINPLASETLAGLSADLAILGCNGIDADGRVTNVNLPEAEVKRAMLAASDHRILVADSSKHGKRHLGLIGTLADFDTIVADVDATGWMGDLASASGTDAIFVGGVADPSH
jgi:DeoR family transcriptional regulator of aga operon